MMGQGIRLTMIAALAIAMSMPVAVHPCSPDLPPAYVWASPGNLLIEMPELDFYAELAFHYGPRKEAEASQNYTPGPSQLELEIAQLRDVLDRGPLDAATKERLVTAYKNIRTTMGQQKNPIPPRQIHQGPLNPGAADYAPFVIEKPARIDLDRFEPVFNELPKEFALYTKGAVAYLSGDLGTAIDLWEALLNLPEDERRYRSVWAAFMVGKATMQIDSAAAIPHFERTRALADEGYPDPLNLAHDSLGWQGQVEAVTEDYPSALRHFLEQYRASKDRYRDNSRVSIHFVCRYLLRGTPIPEAVLRDPVCREVVTLWVLSGRANSRESYRWTEAMVATPPDFPLALSGRMAHFYYEAGHMERAAQWVEQAAPDDGIAQWVHAKLLLRDGKLDEAEVVMAKLTGSTASGDLDLPEGVGWRDIHRWYVPVPAHPDIELGALRLNQGNYVGALEAFLRAGSVFDATYVAEQVMTAGELEGFLGNWPSETVDPATPTSYGREFTYAGILEYLLARKLARQGDFEAARPYFPEVLPKFRWGPEEEAIPVRELLDRYVVVHRNSSDKSLGNRVRARGLMDAAALRRAWGMELFGTEHGPDGRCYEGQYKASSTYRVRSGIATEDERARVEANLPVPNKRFHYRYDLNDAYWEAAQLLPDNDIETAKALWYGGKRAQRNRTGEADKFYKALVHRCRKLPIGQEADARRWFPPKPDDWTFPTDRVWTTTSGVSEAASGTEALLYDNE